MSNKKIIKVDKSLAREIEDLAGSKGITHVQASRLIAKKLRNKKDSEFYHF